MEDGEAGHGHAAEPARGEGETRGSAGGHPRDAAEAARTVLHPRRGVHTGGHIAHRHPDTLSSAL